MDGGTLDQRITAWSNLARLYSWPNEHHENLGSADVPAWGYASPYHLLTRHSPQHTGSEVVHGHLLVNNGYWDTFRTCWPLYSLLTPEHAPQMLDGILQQSRDGGWMARWAAPGYIDFMPGTTSDAIFAEASCHQTLADELEAYDATLRNATVPSDDAAVGRKGLARSRFVGWADIETDEGLAWTMDAATCDAAIALWSRRLAEGAATDPLLTARADEFAANHRWFLNRSLAHQAMFDTDTGFYRGRRRDGRFRTPAADFDPFTWGLDYTETNAWGQAFHAPHDGAGRARLLGGEGALEGKLDALLTTPAHTHPGMWGGYLYNTQEMNEAEADGIGQLAISNQPAHHIPFMYLFTGQHHKTQWLTRELLDKKFVGSEIGQGYPGDEDNGSMSGYWLCLAMGLFPLFPGSGEWVITTPLFQELSFRRDNGTLLRITADKPHLRYIASLRINGQPWHEVTLPVSTLLDDVHLDFELSATPTAWGQDSRPLSTSQLTDTGRWQPDWTTSAQLSAHAELTDDEGLSDVPLQAGEAVELHWEEPFVPHLLTLTRIRARAPQLRIDIRDTQGWADAGITPRRPRFANQTQAYLLPERPITGLRLTATAPTSLSQVEVY